MATNGVLVPGGANLTDLVLRGVKEIAGIVPHNPVFWVLVSLPLAGFAAFRLTMWCLKRTARRAMIQVKNIKQFVSHGHFLDLQPEFAEAMRNSKEYCQVTSLASYLGSLDYGNDEDVAYRIVSTLAATFAGDSILPIIPLVPASLLPKDKLIKGTGLLARFTFAEFPSILTLAALVDSATQLSRQVKDKQQNVDLPKGMVLDAMDFLARGEAGQTSEPKIIPVLPASLTNNEVFTLNSQNTLSMYVEREMDLGDRPDLRRFDFPKPFAPDLLPGLCKGNGGLRHTCTPRMMCHNRVLTALFNRLAANFMAWADYGPFSADEGTVYKEFKIVIGDGDAATTVYTCADFIRALLKHGGGEVVASIRTNVTSFGIGFCVLHDPFPEGMEVDPTDEAQRFRYTQIPLAFCTRTGMVCPTTGEAINQLSSHSGVEWHFKNNRLLGEEEVIVTFYSGIEGFTGFKAGGEWDRPWSTLSASIRLLTNDEALAAADLAACEAVCSNICVRVWKFPFGGYGGLGVCADSVAAVEHALRGRTTIFPLFMRGDAKNGLLYVMHEHIRTRLMHKLDFMPFDDLRGHLISEFLELMNKFARTVIRLPNDIQVEPHEVADSLDRVAACILNSPFYQDQYERLRLRTVKLGWLTALKEFETDFQSFARAPKSFDRQKSDWRL